MYSRGLRIFNSKQVHDLGSVYLVGYNRGSEVEVIMDRVSRSDGEAASVYIILTGKPPGRQIGYHLAACEDIDSEDGRWMEVTWDMYSGRILLAILNL
jgi:hypothetical protein